MVDERSFRNALGNFATGVVVITSRFPDGTPVGVTISAFASLSLSPPEIVFCLRKESYTIPAFFKGSFFAVNLLAEDQQDLSQKFSRKDDDLWKGVPVDTSKRGPFLLRGCLTWLECQTHDIFDGGDHVIISADVEKVTIGDQSRSPLVYFRGAYAALR